MKRVSFHIVIIALLAAVVAASCEEIIEFRGDRVEPKIVVYSLFDPDSVVTVLLSKSYPVFDRPANPQQITNATVRLYRNDVLVSTLVYQPLPVNYIFSSIESYSRYIAPDIRPEPGSLYRLEAEIPGMRPVWAEVELPTPVPVAGLDTMSATGVYGQKYLRTKIRFNDPVGESNFFRVNVAMWDGYYTGPLRDPWSDEYSVYVYREDYTGVVVDDPLLRPSGNEDLFGISGDNPFYIFSDELISGKGYDLSFRLYRAEKNYSHYEFTHYHIDLQSISHDLYLYLRSLSFHRNTGNSPFTEPVIVYTNVVNGLGIVGARVSSKVIIEFGEYPVEGVPYEYNTW